MRNFLVQPVAGLDLTGTSVELTPPLYVTDPEGGGLAAILRKGAIPKGGSTFISDVQRDWDSWVWLPGLSSDINSLSCQFPSKNEKFTSPLSLRTGKDGQGPGGGAWTTYLVWKSIVELKTFGGKNQQYHTKSGFRNSKISKLSRNSEHNEPPPKYYLQKKTGKNRGWCA